MKLIFLRRDRVLMEHLAELGNLPELMDVVRSSLAVATDLLTLSIDQKVFGRSPSGNRKGLYLGPGPKSVGTEKESIYALEFEPNIDDLRQLGQLKESDFGDSDSFVVRRAIHLIYEILSNLRDGWEYSIGASQLRLEKTDGTYHVVIN